MDMSIQTIAKRNTNEKTVQQNFRLPKDLLKDLAQIAAEESTSKTVIVESAIRAKLQEYKLTKRLNLELV